MKKIKIFLFSILFLFISCREEIISPDNPTGNINEPFLTRTNNSYIFSINANDITATINDNTFLNSVKSNIYSIIADYSSGYVEVKVKTSGNSVLYSEVFESNTRGSLRNINGYHPEIIAINFQHFTGKLKVTLSRSQ
jgi:hypothetical protein